MLTWCSERKKAVGRRIPMRGRRGNWTTRAGQLAQNTSDLPDKNASYWFQWEMLSFGPSIFSGPKKMDGLLALGVVGE